MLSAVQKWVGWNVCGWTRVVGVSAYARDAANAARYCVDDEMLDLIREPDNAHDKNAIMVFYGAKHIGYIERHTAAALNKGFSVEMPIRALFKRGYVGESGAIAIDILPQMPSSPERKSGGWNI